MEGTSAAIPGILWDRLLQSSGILQWLRLFLSGQLQRQDVLAAVHRHSDFCRFVFRVQVRDEDEARQAERDGSVEWQE